MPALLIIIDIARKIIYIYIVYIYIYIYIQYPDKSIRPPGNLHTNSIQVDLYIKEYVHKLLEILYF